MKKTEEGYKDTPAQDFPHTSSDADVGNGIVNRHLSESSDQQAQRNELSRALEDLLVDANDWLELTDHPDGRAIVDRLEEAYELLGMSIEDSDSETLDPEAGAATPVRGSDLDNTEEVGTDAEVEEELRGSFPASDPPANY